MKILIFDGSFKTTAFINRLAAGLAKRHQSIFVTQGGNRFLKLVDKKIINQVQVYTLYKYIIDSKTGFLINNTPKEWAQKIIEIYSIRDTLPQISKNAREYIKANYDSNKNIDLYIKEFQEL